MPKGFCVTELRRIRFGVGIGRNNCLINLKHTGKLEPVSEEWLSPWKKCPPRHSFLGTNVPPDTRNEEKMSPRVKVSPQYIIV